MDGFGFPLFVLAAFAGGFVSGFSGFAMGLVVSGVWLHIITPQWRGWTKDLQRAVFQPVLFAAFVVVSISMGITGAVTSETLKLYGLGMPFLLAGLWSGFRLYGKIDERRSARRC
jgi:uncharacterized protein